VSALVIIPARKGSKRFPGKNRCFVGEQSMLRRAIMAAREGGTLIRDIIVTTDDSVVAEMASALGVLAYGRPRELANDEASLDDVARWAYSQWCSDHCTHPLEGGDIAPEIVCIIQPNCPVWKSGTVLGILSTMMVEDELTACATAHPVREQPYWMLEESEEGLAHFHIDGPEVRGFRAQEMPPAFRLDGQVVAVASDTLFRTDGVKGAYEYMGDKIGLYKREWIYGIDVDEPFDRVMAEAAVKWLEKNGEGSSEE